jgi:DNA polymerase I-like protein with 3'-5' exonuclease and polymerase domains
MNYIVTNRKNYFERIGEYNYCSLEEVSLPSKIAVDTETTSIKPHKGEMFAVQVGTGSDNYLFDLDSVPIKDVIPLLENRVLVFHNAKFDLGWFYKYGFFPWKVRDTFLASKILHNGLVTVRHSFGELMSRELKIDYDKSEQKNIAKVKLSTSKAIQYCFNDVDKLLELDTALNKQIIDGGYLNAYQLHRRHVRALAYMEQCGVPFSLPKWKQKIERDKLELKGKEAKVIEYIYENCPKYRTKQLDLFGIRKDITISISSPAQMINVLNDLGINTVDPEGKESTAEDVIKKTKHEFVDIFLEYKSIAHDVSTFGENFLPSMHKGRLYTSYRPIMDTARISAGGRNADKTKEINTLNMPANQKTRECVEALPGYKYLVSDYSGQETVTGADITGDEAMISSIVNNSCLHCAFARVLNPELAELSDEEIIENHKSKRQAAKGPRFCFQFGGSAFTLAQNENIPLEEAMNIENAYRELHSGIYRYGDKKILEAIELGYIESTYGFKLHLPNFDSFKNKHKWLVNLSQEFWGKYKIGKTEYRAEKKAKEDKELYIVGNRECYDLYKKHSYDISMYFKSKSQYYKLCLNNPTQTKAAFQTKAATNKIYEHIWKKKHFWKARISLVLHDEINMEVLERLSKEYKGVIEDAMVNQGNTFLANPLLFMKAEANIGDNWYEAK